jgi:hypothetical protein
LQESCRILDDSWKGDSIKRNEKGRHNLGFPDDILLIGWSKKHMRCAGCHVDASIMRENLRDEEYPHLLLLPNTIGTNLPPWDEDIKTLAC